jgi:hypothetical protein
MMETWEKTMDLKIVVHPHPHPWRREEVTVLMQRSFCRETGESKWNTVPVEIGLAMEVPKVGHG